MRAIAINEIGNYPIIDQDTRQRLYNHINDNTRHIPVIEVDSNHFDTETYEFQFTDDQATIIEDEDTSTIILNLMGSSLFMTVMPGGNKVTLTSISTTTNGSLGGYSILYSTSTKKGQLSEVIAPTVSVSSTGTATDEISYITINGTEKKIAGGSSSSSITLDSEPTYNSSNGVTSGGVYSALSNKQKTLDFLSVSYTDPFGTYTSGGYDLGITNVT